MRAAVLTLTFASLFAAAPASAEVMGDAVAGVAGSDVDPQLGLRAGAATDAIGVLVSADWTYDRDDVTCCDHYEHRDRFRALAHVELPFGIGTGTTLAIRLGAGVELARLDEYFVGWLPGSMSSMRTDRDLGSAYEAALGLYHEAGIVAIGGELGVATALHDDDEVSRHESQRTEFFARLVGRFAR